MGKGNRRLALSAAAWMIAAGSLLAPGVAAEEQTLPNIVLLIFDDADVESMTRMPNITSLIGDQGATFDRFYATEPLCCPSRASIYTGEYVHNHQVRSNSATTGGFEQFRALGHENRSIAALLQPRGYSTGFFGKYLNGYGPRSDTHRYIPPFWGRWFATFGASRYDYRANDQGKLRRYESEPSDYVDTKIMSRATGWINNKIRFGDTPFLAVVNVHAPHSPHVDPPTHPTGFEGEVPPAFSKPSFNEEDMSDKPKHMLIRSLDETMIERVGETYPKRLRMMLPADDFIENLVTRLAGKEILDDTYIFVTSDNGWMQGEHRSIESKFRPYEESVNLPLLVRGPGITPGTRIGRLASTIDLYSTFADISGERADRDGRSLLPLFWPTPPRWRDALLIENLAGATQQPDYSGIVTDSYKYIEYASDEHEFYDRALDPYEIGSVHDSPEYAPVRSGLDRRLEELVNCSETTTTCREADASTP